MMVFDIQKALVAWGKGQIRQAVVTAWTDRRDIERASRNASLSVAVFLRDLVRRGRNSDDPRVIEVGEGAERALEELGWIR